MPLLHYRAGIKVLSFRANVWMDDIRKPQNWGVRGLATGARLTPRKTLLPTCVILHAEWVRSSADT